MNLLGQSLELHGMLNLEEQEFKRFSSSRTRKPKSSGVKLKTESGTPDIPCEDLRQDHRQDRGGRQGARPWPESSHHKRSATTTIEHSLRHECFGIDHV